MQGPLHSHNNLANKVAMSNGGGGLYMYTLKEEYRMTKECCKAVIILPIQIFMPIQIFTKMYVT